jgi:hypothetical protein
MRDLLMLKHPFSRTWPSREGSSVDPRTVAKSGNTVGFVSLACLVLTALFGGAAAPASAASITAPAMNWVLPLWTKEGYRTMTARGSEARFINSNHVEVVDLNLTLFSGDAATRVETILLSPAATFLPQDKIARGEKSVRYIGDDIEASGVRWTYLHVQKKISLEGNVRVTFRAELKNLLQ